MVECYGYMSILPATIPFYPVSSLLPYTLYVVSSPLPYRSYLATLLPYPSLVLKAFSPQHLLLAILTRERPGKTDHIQWYTWTLGGHVKESHIPRKTDRKHGPWNDRAFDNILSSESHFTAVQKGMSHPFTCPPNIQVRHCTWSVLPGLEPH